MTWRCGGSSPTARPEPAPEGRCSSRGARPSGSKGMLVECVRLAARSPLASRRSCLGIRFLPSRTRPPRWRGARSLTRNRSHGKTHPHAVLAALRGAGPICSAGNGDCAHAIEHTPVGVSLHRLGRGGTRSLGAAAGRLCVGTLAWRLGRSRRALVGLVPSGVCSLRGLARPFPAHTNPY